MKARIGWKLAALLGIGLGAYEGLRRWDRRQAKPHRTARIAAIGDALADARGYTDTPRKGAVEVEDPETELDYEYENVRWVA